MSILFFIFGFVLKLLLLILFTVAVFVVFLFISLLIKPIPAGDLGDEEETEYLANEMTDAISKYWMPALLGLAYIAYHL